MATAFNEGRFLASVQRGLAQCQTILTSEKRVVPLSEVGHLYSDKYLVCEWLCEQASSCFVQTLKSIGLTPQILESLRGAASQRNAVLRFETRLACAFVRKQERRVQSNTTHVREYVTGAFSGAFKFGSSYKNVEFVWKLTHTWTLSLVCGLSSHVLATREASGEMLTATDDAPYPAVGGADSAELICNWALLPVVPIDRAVAVTPRRNPQAEAALSFARECSQWAKRVVSMLRTDTLLKNTGVVDTNCLNSATLFVPVLPLLAPESPSLLPDAPLLADMHSRALSAKRADVDKALDAAALFSPLEGWLIVASLHLADVATQLGDGIQYLEALLRKQLIAAIGKVVGPEDFAQYMRFHLSRLLLPEYAPRAFCYAIRRPDHYPEGILSLEVSPAEDLSRRAPSSVEQCVEQGVCTYVSSGQTYPEQFWYLCRSCWSGENNGCCASCVSSCHAGHDVVPFKKSGFFCDCGSGAAPSPCRVAARDAYLESVPAGPPLEIETLVCAAAAPSTWRFALSAAADVRFHAAPLLHGWIAPRFAQQGGQRLTLLARARQFSSFLVLLGRITGPGSFAPEQGFILQNKDEVSIPLDSETVPSAKEFREAIASISPEQQRFAKAFRAMQLESSLFAVCVVQIKPQLEKLLNLPNDALTKEIRLTQDLLELFIKYNIPSDLLSFDRLLNDDQTPLAAVKTHVASMQKMIESKKETEISDAAVGFAYSALTTGAPPAAPTGQAFGSFSFGSVAPGGGAPLSGGSGGFAGGMEGGFGGGGFGSGGGSFGAAASGAGAANIPRAEPFVRAVATLEQAAQPVVLKLLPKEEGATGSVVALSGAERADYSKVPAQLDAVLDKQDSNLRPTILKVSENWMKTSQRGLLSNPVQQTIGHEQQVLERDKCNDLLDALSRSGQLDFDDVQLHLVLAVSHGFDATLMDTLVIKNVNPIEVVENDALLIAETVFQTPRAKMIVKILE